MKRWLPIILLALLAMPASQAQTFVQKKLFTIASAGSFSFTSNLGAGNTVILAFSTNSSTTTVTSVVGTQLHTYTQKIAIADSTGQADTSTFQYEMDGATAAGETVTITYSPGSIAEGYGIEYSGLAAAAFDKTANANGNSGTQNSGNTATTTFANELLLGYMKGNAGSFTAGSGYTLRSADANNFFQMIEDQNVTSTGAYAATATSASQHWVAVISTWKSASQPAANKTMPPTVLTILSRLLLRLMPSYWVYR
jgi:hypothetical protein